MAGAHVLFELESAEAEAQFLRTYLAEAWKHFQASEFFETGWFWRFGQFNEYAGHQRGRVSLVFEGDPDALIESEKERWQDVDGLLGWELHRYQNSGARRGGGQRIEDRFDSLLEEQQARKGEIAGEWQYRLLPLAARFSLAYLREFETPVPAVAAKSEENLTGVGFWSHVHYTMIQCGYDWFDETDACLKGLKFRLKTIASDLDAETAREEYNRLKTEWEAYEDELETWLAEHPEGVADEL